MITVNLPDSKFGILAFLMLLAVLSSCGSEDVPEYVPPHSAADLATVTPHPKQIEFEGINPDGLKILAIGNSFTGNGTYYIPWLLKELNDDEAFIAKLCQSGASLSMHWTNHIENLTNYTMKYSHGGEWNDVSITTLDEALQVFDWDIIIIQQMSTEAGRESTYQPYLDYLLRLISDTNSGARTGWQYTWAFTPDASSWHLGFKYYDNDPEIMYQAIIKTQSLFADRFDIKIPSFQVVRKLRENFPQQKDGFSTDGVHLTEAGCYALSCLWYETLIKPELNTSCLCDEGIHTEISTDFAHEAHKIIKDILF